ncbi:MAG: alpha/beta fold hydrolase [Fibrobacter sp.]|nr:alpha/beta fold hydrolase [Fibrobacter sp.]
MKETWFWLPDWASDMRLWEDELVDVSPDADHTFVSYEEMVRHADDIFAMDGIAQASTVVGWGMGALVLMKNAAKRPKDQAWLLLAPFANFCSDESNWSEQNLHFIANQTLSTVEPSLNAFMELYEEENGEWVEDWAKAAGKMNPKALGDGLRYLAQNRIDQKIPENAATRVFYGRMDQAVKPEMTLGLQPLLPGAVFKERPKAGHWPPMLLV